MNQPSIYKTKVSLQLDNEVIVALDRKAATDNTSRNAVANYILSHELNMIIKSFSNRDKKRLRELEAKNWEARHHV